MLSGHRAKLQSLTQGQCSLLFDKTTGSPDANIIFTHEGITLQYSLMSVAKLDEGTRLWLNHYHAFLEKQKKQKMTPVLPRCNVIIKASLNGTLQYFLTYMVQYPDESIAQDTAQGSLYATEGLGINIESPPPARRPAGEQW
jgi:hypothetical protein